MVSVRGSISPAPDGVMREDEATSREQKAAVGTDPASSVPARAAFALAVIYLLLLLVASHLPAPGGVWAAAAGVLVFLYFPMAIIYHGVRIPLRWGVEVVAGLISIGVWLAFTGLEQEGNASLIVPARSVALLSACLFFGMFVSRIIRDRNLLLPACLMAAAADILSVGWGFTGQALQEAPGLVAKLSVAVPEVGRPPEAAAAGFPLLAIMGVGDLFFLALFFAAAARHGLALRRTFCYVFPLVVVAMVLTVTDLLPWEGVPGLPFICAGFLVANRKSFQLSRSEWISLGVVGAVLLVVVTLGLLARSLLL
jgi:hypothetical protein